MSEPNVNTTRNIRSRLSNLPKKSAVLRQPKELGIPRRNHPTWLQKAVGSRHIGYWRRCTHAPESAMSLAEELAMLRKRVKDQDKEIRRLKEENEFLEGSKRFFAASRRKSARTKNDVHCHKNEKA